MFGPVGLFEEVKAPGAGEQRGRSVGYESRIMMTMFQEAIRVSVCLHVLSLNTLGLFVNHRHRVQVYFTVSRH